MNRRVLIYLVMMWDQKKKGLCTISELPTQTAALLFLSLMSAALRNQSPLLTTLST